MNKSRWPASEAPSESPEFPPPSEGGSPARRDVQLVESVRRAVAILRCFSVEQPEWGIAELSRRLRMNKSTGFRLLATLEHDGMVQQIEPGRYVIGFALNEVGSAALGGQSMHIAISEVLQGLVKLTGETAHLAVIDDFDVLYIEKHESLRALKMPSAVGRRVPLNCTSLGKVLLAGMPDEQLRRVIFGTEWPSLTPNSITDPDALMAEVERVRRQGYATDQEEIEEGLMCIAGPLVDETGRTCAGVSIAGPSSRVGAGLDAYARDVRDACQTLSTRLGSHVRRLGPSQLNTSQLND